MASRILEKIRALVRAGLYVMRLHAEDEMEDDGFEIFDVECALLNGKIVSRQTDRRSKERKYRLRGPSADNTRSLVVVVKIGPTGLLVILTIYAD